MQLASVEDGVHERFDVLGGQVEALAREVQQNMQPRPDQLQMMVELSAPSVSVSTLNAMLMKAQIMRKGLKVQKCQVSGGEAASTQTAKASGRGDESSS